MYPLLLLYIHCYYYVSIVITIYPLLVHLSIPLQDDTCHSINSGPIDMLSQDSTIASPLPVSTNSNGSKVNTYNTCNTILIGYIKYYSLDILFLNE